MTLPTVHDYGCPTTPGANLRPAILAAEADNADGIVIPKGSFTLPSTTDVGIPLVMDHGAVLNKAAGADLILYSSFSAPYAKVFEGEGHAFFRGGVTPIMPEWWGAKANNPLAGLMNSTAINKAMRCAERSGCRGPASGGGGVVKLGYGRYAYSAGIEFKSGVVVEGMGSGGDLSGIHALGSYCPTMLVWTGPQTGNPFLTSWDNDVSWTRLSDLTIDARNDDVYRGFGTDGPIGFLWRSGRGNQIKRVNLLRASYGFLQQANIMGGLSTFQEIDELAIHLCHEGWRQSGFDFPGALLQGAGAITNSHFGRIRIYGYERRGVDLVSWTDNNAFRDLLLIPAGPDVHGTGEGAIGLYVNSGNPPAAIGVGNDCFDRIKIYHVEGYHGPVAVINRTDGPGPTPASSEPSLVTMNGSFTGDQPVVQNGGRLSIRFDGQPYSAPTPAVLVGGGQPLTGTAGAAFVQHDAATALFSLEDFCTNWGKNYADLLLKELSWITIWDPMSATGAIRLDDRNGGLATAPVAPGAAGRTTSKVDLRAFANAYWRNGQRELVLATRGNGTVAPIIYHSLVKAVFDLGQ